MKKKAAHHAKIKKVHDHLKKATEAVKKLHHHMKQSTKDRADERRGETHRKRKVRRHDDY